MELELTATSALFPGALYNVLPYRSVEYGRRGVSDQFKMDAFGPQHKVGSWYTQSAEVG
jgi:hypothetical protein